MFHSHDKKQKNKCITKEIFLNNKSCFSYCSVTDPSHVSGKKKRKKKEEYLARSYKISERHHCNGSTETCLNSMSYQKGYSRVVNCY